MRHHECRQRRDCQRGTQRIGGELERTLGRRIGGDFVMSVPQRREAMREGDGGPGARKDDVGAQQQAARAVPTRRARMGAEHRAGREAREKAQAYRHAQRVSEVGAVQPHHAEHSGADGDVKPVVRDVSCARLRQRT